MSSSPSDRTNPKDCFSCRLVSTLMLTGLGVHALRQARPVAPGSRTSKRILGLVGIGLLGVGLVRGLPLLESARGGNTSEVNRVAREDVDVDSALKNRQ